MANIALKMEFDPRVFAPPPVYPLPINGIFDAINVMNWTFAFSGKFAICNIDDATW